MSKIAVMGYGVVGSGVVEVIDTNKNSITSKVGEEISIKYILDKRNFPDDPHNNIIVSDFNTILNDSEISVVVEVMGGLNPAYDFTKRLLLSGKHVVTSNKELVASHGTELLKIAKDNNLNYLFEASVGGGIPIIRPLNNCLAANEITEIKGILNGTTNYILTKMFKEGKDFAVALKEAQDKGYAERDPAADIEGHDACRKISILSSLVFGKHIAYEKIKTLGITDITKIDVLYAEKINCVIKLVGSAEIVNDKVFASVEPAIISNDNPLAGVEGVFNSILVKGNAIGDVMFYGQGAGKLPTASAVVADVIDSVRNCDRNNRYIWDEANYEIVQPYENNISKFLIRIKGSYTDFQTDINDKFGDIKVISILGDEFAFISEPMQISKLDKKLQKLDVIKKIKILD